MTDDSPTCLSCLATLAVIVVGIAFGIWYYFGRPGEVLPPQWATVELAGVTMTNRPSRIWVGVDVRLADGRKVQIQGVRAMEAGTRICVRGAKPRGSPSLALRLLPDNECAGG
jgi:hypothetical protein